MKKNFFSEGQFFPKILLFVFISNLIFAQNSLTLLSPNGGEVFQVGTYQGIAWNAKGVERINISYSKDNGQNWRRIFNNIPAKINAISWRIPNLPNEKLYIKVEDVSGNNFDVSDSYFEIKLNNSTSKILSKSASRNDVPIFIMPLGNSITYGVTNNTLSVADKKSYRYVLYDSLINSGYNFVFSGSEHSGWNYLPQNYDANAGFPGIKDNELAYLLETGIKKMPGTVTDTITDGPYLDTYPADIILLHIGTNGNDLPGGKSPWDVEDILNDIDNYENTSGKHVTVILARIINRAHNQPYVTVFNDSVEAMALDRVTNPSNPHYPDDIKIVDMENIPGFDYTIDSVGTIGDGIPGDMASELHPNEKGYAKMANVWFEAIKSVLGSPPKITQQPVSQGVFEGDEVTLSVSVSDTNGINFQWYRNNVIIEGATNSEYLISSASLADNGALFKCAVFNSAASIFSDEVAIYVTPKKQRVVSEAQVIYNFNEGNGNTVHDISELGESLNLTITDTTKINWTQFGLNINSGASIVSLSSPLKIFNSCTQSNEITIETWLKPGLLTQYGPARIVTYSKNKEERNFTLSQDGNSFQTRLRTMSTNNNGKPALNSNDFSELNVMHVVYTHSKNGDSKFFINGEMVSNTNITGEFLNWNSSYSFGIGNEFIDQRSWLGTIFYTAVFSRALNRNEIQHNYNLGLNGVTFIGAPANISANVLDSNKVVSLTWEDTLTVEKGFIIEGRPNDVNSDFIVIDTVDANITTYQDTSIKEFSEYQYRIFAFSDYIKSAPSDTVTLSLVSVDKAELPTQFSLSQNYPNPFNPSTTIKYSLPIESNVKITVYNSIGQKVFDLVNTFQLPGNYQVIVNAKDLCSGVYFYAISAYSLNNKLKFQKVKKFLLLK